MARPAVTPGGVILVIGGTGQIGHELVRELAALGTVVAPSRAELDLRAPKLVREYLRRTRPTFVVNAAAYTAVDRAETEPVHCALTNAEAPAQLAAECNLLDAPLVHFSTDYVFDGSKGTPYVESDATAPLNVYGRTKRDGEDAIAAAGGAYLIFRTSWVYGPRGNNFPRTIWRLARERDELPVVDDQVGAPTCATDIATAVAEVIGSLMRGPDSRAAFHAATGLYHMTASGSTTWYEFARAILAGEAHRAVVRPVCTADYPTAAARPSYSILDNGKLAERFNVQLAPWTEQWVRARDGRLA